MEVKFSQITDIHLGGDYDGFFSTRENFIRLLDASFGENTFLIITGDLADRDFEQNYDFIKKEVELRFGQRYAVIPGNHDEVNVLRDVFKGHTDSFYYEWVPVSLVPTYWNPAAGIEFGIGKLDKSFNPEQQMLKNSLVFTHYPVIDTMHKFMNKHALARPDKEAILKMMRDSGSKLIFCGHFHDCVHTEVCNRIADIYDMQNGPSEYRVELIDQYICPASQCQIDRTAESFSCTSKEPNGLRITVRGEPGDCVDRFSVDVTRIFSK